jgi:hypothetical protein
MFAVFTLNVDNIPQARVHVKIPEGIEPKTVEEWCARWGGEIGAVSHVKKRECLFFTFKAPESAAVFVKVCPDPLIVKSTG